MAEFLLRLPDVRMEELKKLSRDSGVSVSHCTRQAIYRFLDDKIPCTVIVSGCIASGYVMIMKGGA